MGSDELMRALLGEAQLHQHVHHRAIVWLTAVRPLIQVHDKRTCQSIPLFGCHTRNIDGLAACTELIFKILSRFYAMCY